MVNVVHCYRSLRPLKFYSKVLAHILATAILIAAGE